MLLLALSKTQLSPLQPKWDLFVFRNNTNLFSWLNKVICRVLLWEGCVSLSWMKQSLGWIGWLLGWNSPLHTEVSFQRQAEPSLRDCRCLCITAGFIVGIPFLHPHVEFMFVLLQNVMNPTSCTFPSSPVVWALVSTAKEANGAQETNPLHGLCCLTDVRSQFLLVCQSL